jgi:hypothetical protein
MAVAIHQLKDLDLAIHTWKVVQELATAVLGGEESKHELEWLTAP